MRILPIIGVAIAAVVILIAMTFFRVDERQQALVLQFGQVKQVITEPGLAWKVPLIQNVVFYEDRILPLGTSALEVTPADERRLIVDAFARWRIVDVIEFRQSVQTEANATQRLERILNAALREVLGAVSSKDVLSPERSVLMTRIRDAAREEAEALGVRIIDVRIRRADLPEQNLQATFDRMEAERQREAADERARGEERAQEVRATADRAAVEIVSDARRQSEIIRGQADAERNAIYAQAFGRDEEFFAFYRSLSAYETALKGENSTLVMSPDSEFFDYLRTDRGQFATVPEQPVVVPGEGAASDVGQTSPGDAAAGGDDATATEPEPVVGAPDEETASEQVERILESADKLNEDIREIERGTATAQEGTLPGSAEPDGSEEAGSEAPAEEEPAEEEPAEEEAAGSEEETGEATEGPAETVSETVDGVTVTRTVGSGDEETETETETSN